MLGCWVGRLDYVNCDFSFELLIAVFKALKLCIIKGNKPLNSLQDIVGVKYDGEN